MNIVHLNIAFSGVPSENNIKRNDIHICIRKIIWIIIIRSSQCEKHLSGGGEDGNSELYCEEPRRSEGEHLEDDDGGGDGDRGEGDGDGDEEDDGGMHFM